MSRKWWCDWEQCAEWSLFDGSKPNEEMGRVKLFGKDPARNIADMEILAAAPELLDSLKNMLAAVDYYTQESPQTHGTRVVSQATMDLAIAALEKADGRSER